MVILIIRSFSLIRDFLFGECLLNLESALYFLLLNVLRIIKDSYDVILI